MRKPCIESMIGTWFVDGMPGGEAGLLVITPECRVVQFLSCVKVPHMIQTLRLWGSNDGDDCIRLRPSPAAEGWVRRIEMTDFGWTLIAVRDGMEHRFECRPAPEGSLPPWFAEQLDKNLLKMAEIESNERAEQDGGDNSASLHASP